MHSSLSLLALAGAATAQIRGFNYGALYADNSARMQSDWEADFKAAQNLPGTTGFTSARLFTMIQGYSTGSDIIQALPAAAATNTSLLLGLWCSSGDAAFQLELAALGKAITQYGDQLKDQILGISIGSEDLYRVSPTGIENDSGPGVGPQQLVSYISQARKVLQGTAWADKTIGHVDTWTSYVNASNNPLIEALDWVGVDAYPYFQTVNENSIDNAESLFFDALSATQGAAMGKDVWVTETGWPVTGAKSGLATSGTQNAETYWKAVACKLLGKTNTFWYQLTDGSTSADPSFRVISPEGAPLYDLSCSGVNTTRPSASASALSSATKAAATATGSSSGSAAGSPKEQGQNAGLSSGSGSSSSGSSSSTSGSSSSGSSYQAAAGNSTASANSTYSAPSSTSSHAPSYTGGASAMVGSATTAMILAAGAAVAFL
ncbi:glycoside hydrolase family 17 protein [Dothistroma septosporum NZE10]|uniref:Probable glucan endo-1,3-beta-glucosidase eglC n=1 Tax=Dothistroma septosporum (strain NZE10 / CBS 128990) TaxID=675120 RepID=N1PFM2_DOTSN|nr:glycoside hydrolase family 17 protein [Dothistroma septosporum NZE10]